MYREQLKCFINNLPNLSATGYGVNVKLIDIFNIYLKNNKNNEIKILDFGCSQKPYKYIFDKYDNIIEYIGIDVYNGKKVDIVYDGKKIPFDDNYFDFIFSSSVLEHVENIDFSLKEINRVLKVGGVTVHSVPFINHIHGSPFDFHRPTYYGWLSKMKLANLKNINILTTDSRFCSIINMITSQINASLIKLGKIIFKSRKETQKDISKGDASPENINSKKLALMYFILKLNPINFLLGLSCFISNLFPNNNDKELQITSAYIIKAEK